MSRAEMAQQMADASGLPLVDVLDWDGWDTDDEMEECGEWTAEEIAALNVSNEAAAYTDADITNDIDAADLYDMARDEMAN